MPQPDAQPFGAHDACPTSEKLLAYKNDALSFIAREHVRLHLVSCDFCGAALQLLSKHAAPTELVFTTERERRVPAHVLLLARRLLPATRCDDERRGRRVA